MICFSPSLSVSFRRQCLCLSASFFTLPLCDIKPAIANAAALYFVICPFGFPTHFLSVWVCVSIFVQCLWHRLRVIMCIRVGGCWGGGAYLSMCAWRAENKCVCNCIAGECVYGRESRVCVWGLCLVGSKHVYMILHVCVCVRVVESG